MGENRPALASPEPTAVRERCAVHTDRPSVARCDSCGRPACLSCAVPFRGRILCQECASRELGAPPPAEPVVPRPSRRLDVIVAAVLAVGVIGTVAPWHRAGPLTGMLSAWRPGPQPWPLLASITLVAALPAAGWLLLSASRARPATVALTLLAAISAAATAVALAAAPDYTSPTAAPFVVLATATLAASLGVVRWRRVSG
jgi:hypothetical protein